MNRDNRVTLAGSASLRHEAFGALIYSYADRRLLFIDHQLLPFLASTGDRSVGEIADDLLAQGEMSETAVARTMLLLDGLHQKGIVNVL
jgi:putative mycofactocin binding protein MftB